METIIKRWFSLICSALILVIGLTACSDENPDTESDWRTKLVAHYDIVPLTPEAQGMCGDSFGYISFGIRIVDKDTGEDLLKPGPGSLLESDYYYEIGGLKYRLGDTVGVFSLWPDARNVVQVYGQHYDDYSYLTCLYQSAWYSTSLLKYPPIDYTIDFVWPSKGIRKTLRLYVEFNKNFYEDARNSEPDKNGFGSAWSYKVGYWIDGVASQDYGVNEDGSYVSQYELDMLVIPVEK